MKLVNAESIPVLHIALVFSRLLISLLKGGANVLELSLAYSSRCHLLRFIFSVELSWTREVRAWRMRSLLP